MTLEDIASKPIWRKYSIMDMIALPLVVAIIGVLFHFAYTNVMVSSKINHIEEDSHTHTGLEMITGATDGNHNKYIAICEFGICTYYIKTKRIKNVTKNNK
ncbi:MAG: hypothetical protein GY749_22685 [Desulfobacteraceae bacterium]|nr:hypothetical protein [Desulfobacteraceae bacterium]